ncbi:MAG: TerB family tellurite resistance protein [Flavobacteriaceae bacterium]
MIKWFAAFLGYMFFRFPGALLGFFIGSLVDQFGSGGRQLTGRFSNQTFEMKLLALAAMVIKADGQISPKELAFVRNYFIAQYGQEQAQSIFQRFNTEIKKKTQSIADLSDFFVAYVRYETRLQIIHFLFAIAQADGTVSESELQKIAQIAHGLKLKTQEFEGIKAMFFKAADQAYKILEIDPSASEADIKKAYRTMVKKYHPDRLQTKDPALVKGAQEKFRLVQEAYETIKKERQF